jgi:hypothetical protein
MVMSVLKLYILYSNDRKSIKILFSVNAVNVNYFHSHIFTHVCFNFSLDVTECLEIIDYRIKFQTSLNNRANRIKFQTSLNNRAIRISYNYLFYAKNNNTDLYCI